MQQAITALEGMIDSVLEAVQTFIDKVMEIVGAGISLVVSVSVPSLAAFARMAATVAAGMQMIQDALSGGGGGSGGATASGVVNTSALLGSGPGGGKDGKAAGGYASGLTWVGEHGPELVNLPSGSYVNNSQSSNRMANQPVMAYIDYDELARTLARVLGQQMQRA
jgi:hypothetical protein